MRQRHWSPTAPAVKYDKSSFAFLIAFGRQLELALELELDGSAPDFVSDALGVLANGLEGVTGDALDDEEAAGGLDAGSDDDDGETSGLQAAMAAGDAGTRRGRRALGGAVPGGDNAGGSPLVTMRRVKSLVPVPAAAPVATKGGKRRGKKSTRK